MKWVIAFIIFILIMTVTWDEVEGITIPTNNSTTTTQTTDQSNDQSSDPAPSSQKVLYNGDTTPDNGNDSVPASIPEPGTLILLAGGITALHLMRRRSK